MKLPHWLQENNLTTGDSTDIYVNSARSIVKKKNPTFIEKTLKETINFFSTAIYAEEIAHRNGLLQVLNPKMKVLSLVILILTVNTIHYLGLIWALYFILLLLAYLSQVPLSKFVRQVWLVVPFFTGMIALPSLFNWIVPGDPLWVVWEEGDLYITIQGFKSFFLLISRVGVSVSIAYLLTLTTPWPSLLKAFRSFGLPRIFVSGIEMTYRYLYVLITLVQELLFARKARDAGYSKTGEQRRFIAHSLGTLFSKSLYMTEEVHRSMLARGYTGEIYTLSTNPWRFKDFLALAIIVFSALTFYSADKVLGG